MRNITSCILIVLLCNNIILSTVFASYQIQLSLFTIKVNNGNSYNTNVEANPGDNLKILLSGQNIGNPLTNVYGEFTFSSNNFQYINQGTIDSYNNDETENENIDINAFHPPYDNRVPIATNVTTNAYLDLYYLDIMINQNTPDTLMNITGRFTADGGIASSPLNRAIYINTRPHIIDYYFEKSGTKVSSLQRGGEEIDFIIKVKDYNGCSNIDGVNPIADLSQIGLTNSEPLSLISCDSNTATYKKSAITTLVSPGTKTFGNSHFSIIDENGNSNLANDPHTTFDNEDKKENINLEILSAGDPQVSVSTSDSTIGSILNNTTNISYSGTQDGAIKIIIGNDSTCETGTLIQDWTAGYTANTNSEITINASSLLEATNTVYICLKNDENKIGANSINIQKDTILPNITSIIVSPDDVVTEDSSISFICSENGTYQIEKSGNNTLNSGTTLYTGNVISGSNNNITIHNTHLETGSNNITIFCLDEALNYITHSGNINKTTIPPSLSAVSISLGDNDTDYDGIDGRDFTLNWDNATSNTYAFFESYRIYIIPSNINLNTSTHSHIKILSDKSLNSYTGDESISKDSLGNTLVSTASYKACIAIMGSNGVLGTPGCSTGNIITGDTVAHPKVISAKFTHNNSLEITTDATLDSNIANHSATGISFTYNNNTLTGSSITSIEDNKINLNIPELNNIAATGTNLVISTGSIRAHGGGFNNVQNFNTITDGQVPTIENFSKISSSSFNNFYTGSIDFGYKFGENMKNSYTKFEFTREGGNPDSELHSFAITGENLNSGSKTQSINLSSIGLKDGVYYSVKIIGVDSAGNSITSNQINNIKYDLKGPEEVIKNDIALYSTLTPTLSWDIPSDNNGYGSGIKNYAISIYDNLDCSGSAIQEHTSNINSKIANTLSNMGDYSWKVYAIDNMGNNGVSSSCSTFKIDTNQPIFSSYEIKDTITSLTNYLKSGNQIEIKSQVNDTNSNHIWADISMITGNANNNNELCSAPSSGITCHYSDNIVTYSFISGSNITDGGKQVMLKAQNTSGGNETIIYLSTTADSNIPNIANDALHTPINTIGGTGSNITWDTNKITDSIGLKNIKIEYSNGGDWNVIGNTPNNGTFLWDLNNVVSGSNYKIRFTAYDNAENEFIQEFPTFIIDRTNPDVPYSTIISPNGGELIRGNNNYEIKWGSGSITDTSISNNPILLEYSIDNGTNYNTIADNIANSGVYNWSVPKINSNSVIIKLTAKDTVGNTASDTSNSTFIIDTTPPILDFNYTNTPANGSYINNTGIDITGDTSDIYLKKVMYKFENTSDTTFYDGSTFTSNETWVDICNDPTTQGTNNSCNNIAVNITPNIINGQKYNLTLKSIDEPGNETISVPLEYTGDIINPAISSITQTNTYFQNAINLTGTSSDNGSGISSVKIQIKQGNQYWDGSQFVSTPQTLNTSTTDAYANWNYSFQYSGSDTSFEVTIIAYDSTYKVNNSSSTILTVIKDTQAPIITGGTGLFTSPGSNSLHIGGNDINILWNHNNISDTSAGLTTEPINLEYFDGTNWNTIKESEINDGNYTWSGIPSLDLNNAKIRITATDKAGNVQSQLSEPFIIDSTAPTISSIETMDINANGEIDGLYVIMSEPIQDSSINLGNFSISNSIGTPIGWETGSNINDGSFILKFSDTLDTEITPSLTYTKGELKDLAGKFLESVTKSSIDKAAPRLIKSEIFDENKNGKIDTIIATFSENLSSSIDTTAWSINNILDGMSINSTSVTSSIVTISLNEGSDFNTAANNMQLNFSSNTHWKDVHNNIAGSVSNLSIGDKAEPRLISAEYYDENNNSKVDKVYLTFSEDIKNFIESDFSINGFTVSNKTLSGKVASIDITETSSQHNTGASANISFTSGNLRDNNENLMQNISNQNIVDKVAPKLLSIETGDANNNGKIDFIKFAYSENLNSDFSGFIGEVSGYNVNSYSKFNDSIIKLNVDEKSSYDSGIKPISQVISNTTLTDLNDNKVLASLAITPEDKIGPVIIGARYDESTHKMFLEFSEDIESGDFISSNIVLNNAGTYNIINLDYTDKSMSLSSETIDYTNSEISFKANSVKDSSGNSQSNKVYSKISPPIIINEILTSSNTNNNYIELKNLSEHSVNIGGFQIAGITIPNGVIISSQGYYLISKGTIGNSIINVNPNLVDTNLNISGNQITLNNGIIDIDYANLSLLDTGTPKSIERKTLPGDGKLASNWYQAQVSTGFDNSSPYGTPRTANVQDATAPTISSYFPNDDILLPYSRPTISIEYSDNLGGLGINTNSDNIKLYKWNGSSWGNDIASNSISLATKTITNTKAEYQTNSLEYGKYKIDFSISDTVGNTINKTIIFYIDHIEFDINISNINIGNIYPEELKFSEVEAVITVKTLGAGFDIHMNKTENFNNNGIEITDWDGNHGFGFEHYNLGYNNQPTPIGNQVLIKNETKSINTSGVLNTYTYKIRYAVKVSDTQSAGIYSVQPNFNIKFDY